MVQVTEKVLEDIFSRFGRVKDVRIVTDRITAECKGYGFVTFDESDNIENLLAMKNIEVNGKKIRVRKANRRSSTQFDDVSSSTGIKNEKVLVDNQMLCISTSNEKQPILKVVSTMPLTNHLFTNSNDPSVPGFHGGQGLPGSIIFNNLSDSKEQPTLHIMQHFSNETLMQPTYVVTSQQMPYFFQQRPSVFSTFDTHLSSGYYTALGIPQLSMIMPSKNLHVFPHYNK
nr:cleavage stimulating factor 64-like [Hydra vulgaris]